MSSDGELLDPRILIVGAGALSIVGLAVLSGTDAIIPTVLGGFAWASAGVLSWHALKVKRGESDA